MFNITDCSYQGIDASTATPTPSGAADGHPVLEEDVGQPEVPVTDDRELVGGPHHLHLDGVEVPGGKEDSFFKFQLPLGRVLRSTEEAFFLTDSICR